MKRKIIVTGSNCPCCGSSMTLKLGSQQHALASPDFRVVSDKTCQQCGAVWSRPAPKSLAILAVLLGVLVIIGSVAVIFSGLAYAGEESASIIKVVWPIVGSTAGILIGCGAGFGGIKSFLSRADEGVLRIEPKA